MELMSHVTVHTFPINYCLYLIGISQAAVIKCERLSRDALRVLIIPLTISMHHYRAGNALNFEMDRRLIFEVPLSNVSHTTTSKNEVTLEFHQNDDAAINLMEIRFHVPSEANNADGDPVQVEW